VKNILTIWIPKREPPDPWKTSRPDGFVPDSDGFTETGAFSFAMAGAAAGREGVGFESGRGVAPKGFE